MNRQQRRRLKKQGKEVKKEPVYNVKKQDLMQYAEKAANKLRQQAIDEAFIVTMAIPIYVLRHKYGFGKKRLTDFIEHMLFQYSCLDSDHVSIEDMRHLIKTETGIEVLDTGIIDKVNEMREKERAN